MTIIKTKIFGFCNKNINNVMKKNNSIITKEKAEQYIKTNKYAKTLSSLNSIFYIIFRKNILNLAINIKNKNNPSIYLVILGEIIFAILGFVSYYLFNIQSFYLKKKENKITCLKNDIKRIKYDDILKNNNSILVEIPFNIKDNVLEKNDYDALIKNNEITITVEPATGFINQKKIYILCDAEFYNKNIFKKNDKNILNKISLTKQNIEITIKDKVNNDIVISENKVLNKEAFNINTDKIKSYFILQRKEFISGIENQNISENYNYKKEYLILPNDKINNINNEQILNYKDIDIDWKDKSNKILRYNNIENLLVPIDDYYSKENIKEFKEIFENEDGNYIDVELNQIVNVDSIYNRIENNKMLEVIVFTIFVIFIAFITRKYTIFNGENVINNDINNKENKVILDNFNKKKSNIEIVSNLYNLIIILLYLIPLIFLTKNISELQFARYEEEIIVCQN